ncbi:MAG: hypothetical protein WDN03_06095 [Rhizomicrobium sp.]
MARLTGDLKLLPDVKPSHFATGALSSLSSLAEERLPPAPEPELLDDLPPPPLLPERRFTPERRVGAAPVGGVERRVHVFGRRAADRVL